MKTPFKPPCISYKKLGFHEIYWGKKGLYGRSLKVNCSGLYLLKCKVLEMFS